MKKKSTKPQDDYELNEEYDLSKMTILPKGRFDTKHQIGPHTVVDAGLADLNGKKFKPGKPEVINRNEKQISDLVVENRDVDYQC